MANGKQLVALGALFLDSVYTVEESFLKQKDLTKGSNASISFEALNALKHELGDHCLLQKSPGGSAANVIRGLARQGWDCSLHAKAGDDEKTAFLRADFAAYNINLVLSDSHLSTGEAVAFITPDGERTMRCYLGASGSFRPEDFISATIDGAGLLHAEGYAICNEGLVEHARDSARDEGVPFSFDLANFELVISFKDRILALLEEGVDLLFANEQEAASLLGLQASEAAMALARFASIAVVTQGAHGCWIADRHSGSLFHWPAHHVADIVDTTGAGDLFTAGFLDGYLRGVSLEKAAARGALLASTIIQYPGAIIPKDRWTALNTGLDKLDKLDKLD